MASLHSIFVTYSVDGTVSSDVIGAYTASLFVLVIICTFIGHNSNKFFIGDAFKRLNPLQLHLTSFQENYLQKTVNHN